MGLIDAVDTFIQRHFDEVRGPALDELEMKVTGHSVSVLEIMQVFVEPYVVILERYEWGYDAVRTIARMEFDGNPEVHRLLSKSAGKTVNRFAKLIRPRFPGLKPKQFKVRFNFIVNSVILGFADYQNLHQTYLGDLSPRSLNALASFHTEMAVAALEAP